jgi:4-amino-4-deoxy-L-arabinose transferase-like glycosyltransferase
LTALALVLRAIGSNGGLWYDEIFTLLASARGPLSRIVTAFPDSNQHTLYSVLAHFSIQIFGEHAWSLRLPALLLGVATVPMLFLFAREFVGRTEALLACLLLTVSYHHVWFSQNARGYTTMAFLSLLSSWLLLRGLRRRKASDFVWYGVAAALGLYAHLTMLFLVVSHALLCAIPLGLPLDRNRLRQWRLPVMGFVLAGVLTLLLYAPLLVDMRQFFTRPPMEEETATPRWALLELVRGLHLGLGTWVAALIGGGLFLAGLWSYYRQSPFVLGMFLLPGVITVAVAIGLERPIFPRFLFFLVGFALLIVVRGALEVGRWVGRARLASVDGVPAVGVALVAAMAVASAATLPRNYRHPKQDFDGALRFVETHKAEGEPVVTVAPATYVYQQYYNRSWSGVTSLDQLQRLRAGGRRVWVLYTLKDYVRHETDLLDTLETECAVTEVFHGTLGDGDITVCAIPPVTTPAPVP